MSTDLYWEPTNRVRKTLSKALKWALQKRYGGPVQACIDLNDIQYIQGLVDAGVDGADVLLDAIEKHECIDVYERG